MIKLEHHDVELAADGTTFAETCQADLILLDDPPVSTSSLLCRCFATLMVSQVLRSTRLTTLGTCLVSSREEV